MTGTPTAAAPVPWPKRTRRFLRAHAILLLLRLVGLLPLRWALALGRWGGRLAYPLLGKDRRLALRHLEKAFPERSAIEREEIAKRMFESLGMSAMELAKLPTIDRILDDYVEMPEETLQVLQQARSGRGAVIATGHVGNWELLFRRSIAAGLDAYAVGKESHDPRFTALMQRVRGEGRVIWRGRPGASRQMLRVFRKDAYLALLIDQDTKVQGVFVPFFGELAHTPRAAADLVLRTGAGLAVAFIHRKEGGGHRLVAKEIPVEPTGDTEADVWRMTAAITKEIEQAIRLHPHEWVWMHERWKTRPPASK